MTSTPPVPAQQPLFDEAPDRVEFPPPSRGVRWATLRLTDDMGDWMVEDCRAMFDDAARP